MTTNRLTLSLPQPVTRALRKLAAARGVSHGVLARGLITYALTRVDDPALDTAIDEVATQLHRARSKGGKASAAARWGGEG